MAIPYLMRFSTVLASIKIKINITMANMVQLSVKCIGTMGPTIRKVTVGIEIVVASVIPARAPLAIHKVLHRCTQVNTILSLDTRAMNNITKQQDRIASCQSLMAMATVSITCQWPPNISNAGSETSTMDLLKDPCTHHHRL